MIIDDEPNAVALLASYVEQISFLELRKSGYDGVEALKYLQEEHVDILFVDIEMPGITGMDLAGLVPGDTAIIFTTAYSQYAAESYEKNAVDYLLKPITFTRFLQAVMKAANKGAPKQLAPTSPAGKEAVFVKSGKQWIRLAYDAILFFEGEKEYVKVVTKKESILLYKRMKDLGSELPAFFQRVHHSYIINTHHIQKIEDNHAWIDDRRIPISDSYRESFWKHIRPDVM
ncbi:LytR/AlgR family response regulator transcription factor [Chryseolinea lacunae]|uniref:Response regulator transcription factor n=1 Tax=Chryseolinea lacunae TaxID=2801331 RepID=A0ABS1KZ44_9BACT|nr:LytTR family DNA-binding domain-containing protein [Chryseolinea lacunae]MBL0744605.1 response regulator transcription factor [Chryseolinea lacunae]